MAAEGSARQPFGADGHADAGAGAVARRGCLCRSGGAAGCGCLGSRGRRVGFVASAACACLLVVAAAGLLWRRPARGAGSRGPPSPVLATAGNLSERGVTFAKLAGASYCPVDDIKSWSCGMKCIEGVTNANVCGGHTTKGYVAKWGDSCIVSFMGSKEYLSMITDLEFNKKTSPFPGCKDCRVHTGFLWEWKGMRECVKDSLSGLGCGAQGATVHVTGHSLGGGVAGLAMIALSDAGYQIGESWTFGMPRTGDKGFAKEFNSRFGDRFYRATHHMDPIPHVPPTDFIAKFWHYEHVEPEVYFHGSVSSGFVVCHEDSENECSGKYWDVPHDILHISDHTHYMDIAIGSPGCGKSAAPSPGGADKGVSVRGRKDGPGADSNNRNNLRG